MHNPSSTFSSNRFLKENLRLAEFFAKLFLVCLPCAGVLGFSLFLLAAAGELDSPERLVQAQNQRLRPSLVGLAYSDPVSYLKLKLALLRKPDILALGTSRVLQFRSLFFKNGTFYNAGGTISNLQSVSKFFHQIPRGQEPKIIILGLDQNLFNSRFSRGSDLHGQNRLSSREPFQIYQNSWAIVYKDYFKNKFHLKPFLFKDTRTLKIGFNAVANAEGYREDGSYRYGRFLKAPVDLENRFRPMLEKIKLGKNRFEFGETVDPAAKEELARFLNDCKTRNVHVIGFLPPYAHRLYETLRKSGRHNYIFQLEPELLPLFKQHGFDFYNFSDLAAAGASDRETIDGYHASEKAYLRLFILMLKSSKPLQAYADVKNLEKDLQAAQSDYTVFED